MAGWSLKQKKKLALIIRRLGREGVCGCAAYMHE